MRSSLLKQIFLLLGGIVIALIVTLFFYRNYVPSGITNNFFFLIIYLQFFILLALGLIVGRKTAKLFFDRRIKTLGAKLRTRLVLALLSVALIPTLLLYIVASGLLNNAFDGWFGSRVEGAIEASVLLSRRNFLELKQNVNRISEDLQLELTKKEYLFQKERLESLRTFIEEFRKIKGLFSIVLFSRDEKVLMSVEHPASEIESFKEPAINPEIIKSALSGRKQISSDLEEAGQYIRIATPVNSPSVKAFIISYRVDPELAEAFDLVKDSFANIGQLKVFKEPLQSSYTLTLVLVTACIMFAALWLAFTIANYIIGPIEDLVEATEEISKGNYDVRIEERGNDEISYLVKSFNRMTNDLETSREEVARRRILTDTIIENLTIGVISIDRDGIIQNINTSADKIYQLKDARGNPLDQLMTKDHYQQLAPILEKVNKLSHGEFADQEIVVKSHEKNYRIITLAGKILDAKGSWVGTLILFEDITELSKAQQMSAWREVARRIAHEIKNPLTPIQLSAQRLQKIFSDKDYNGLVKECVDNIVENVTSIKKLADEFSKFARMPAAEYQQVPINKFISEIVSSFANQYHEVTLRFIADDRLSDIEIDPEQFRRILINIFENAVSAIQEADARGKIDVRTVYNKQKNTCQIEVSDNGCGIINDNKMKIFDPYFTTKKNGTGLGLAIVSSIIADHQGQIEVIDNQPSGTKFLLELPVKR